MTLNHSNCCIPTVHTKKKMHGRDTTVLEYILLLTLFGNTIIMIMTKIQGRGTVLQTTDIVVHGNVNWGEPE